MERVGEATDRDGSGAGHRIGDLLERWQTDHDPASLTSVVELLRAPLRRLVSRELSRRGVRDPAACDDAVALVLERLFRLGVPGGTVVAARFEASRAAATSPDPGWTYVRCVARSRAGDVARTRLRRTRHEADYANRRESATRTASTGEECGAEDERLRAAVARLDDQERTVVALLLEGKSQAVIAHVLGVCEGTVSRIRARAIARLRTLLTE